MHQRTDRCRRLRGGFSLLEITLALFVVTLLLGAIFSIVGGTTQLTSSMENQQEREARVHRFAEFCERLLRGLPGEARVRLRAKQSGNHYLSEFAMLNAPPVFAGAGGGNGLTIIETEEEASGYLRVVLKVLSAEEASASELGKADTAKQQRLVLMDGVSQCDWKILNPVSGDYETVWNKDLSFAAEMQRRLQMASPAATAPPPAALPPADASQPAQPNQPVAGTAMTSLPGSAQRPGLVELTLRVGAEPARRFVFWVPPARSPDASGFGGATGTPTQPLPAGTVPNPPVSGNPRIVQPAPARR